ncbi:MAG TPA: AraC family transcriptional regulator [Lentisphaeria bacterium]|nr:AraC family transcriptional regulator [Lentisphaeria bacterium]
MDQSNWKVDLLATLALSQNRFLDQLDPKFRLDLLLNAALGVYFFAKDRQGRIMIANQLTVERCGCQTEDEMIGRTDYDFFPFDLAEKYVVDDLQVMESGEPIFEMMELAPDRDGTLDLYVTNKIALRDRQGLIIGMAGASACFEYRRQSMREYLEIAEAVDHIKQNYQTAMPVASLAELCQMPTRRLAEQFKRVLGLTPQTFVVLVRVHYACLELLRTVVPLAEVAETVGFYDHSCFTRQFSKHMGMTPLAYRKRYAPKSES